MAARRVAWLAGMTLACFGLLLGRVAYLQTFRARELADALSDMRVQAEIVAPARGALLDVHGRPLARDVDSYDFWIVAAGPGGRGRNPRGPSRLGPLAEERLAHLARLEGPVREAELGQAAADLARANALVAFLAGALPPPLGLGSAGGPDGPDAPDPEAFWAAREAVARRMLEAVLRRARDRDALREPVLFLRDVPYAVWARALRLRADPGGDDFGALRPALGRRRQYPQGPRAAQLVGYVSELDAGEYAVLRGRWLEGEADPLPGAGELRGRGGAGRPVMSIRPGPGDPADRPTDEARWLRLRTADGPDGLRRVTRFLPDARVGRSGLEEHYNDLLRGRHALREWVLDRPEAGAPRRRVPARMPVRPRDGTDITVSLDLRLQRRVEDLLAEAVRRLSRLSENAGLPVAASAVVMDVHTGRLPALASFPGFDPGRLRTDFPLLAADPAGPLRHHAVNDHFAPGSVVKPLVALAALESGRWDPDEACECEGSVWVGSRLVDGRRVGGRKVRCLNRAGHGSLDVRHALMVSCNPAFIQLAERVGSPDLYETFRRFGFGRRTGVDLAGEAPGLLPRSAYTRQGFSAGDLANLALGQGYLAATPLQVAVAFAALANADAAGARLVRPHLAVPGPDWTGPDARLDMPRATAPVSPEALRVVRDGLYMVVQGDGAQRGTGRTAAFIGEPGGRGMPVAGKTGSAEIDARRDTDRRRHSHAWFAAYAPADRPRVVVVVVVEWGDLGGETCGPLVKEILRAYFAETDPDRVFTPEGGVG